MLTDRTRVSGPAIAETHPIEYAKIGINGLQALLQKTRPMSIDRPPLLQRLGHAYLSLSEATFNEAIKSDSENRCALLKESAAAHAKALELLRQIVAAYPDASRVRFDAATLLVREQPSEALSLCSERIDKAKREGLLCRSRSRVAARDARRGESWSCATPTLRHHPCRAERRARVPRTISPGRVGVGRRKRRGSQAAFARGTANQPGA